MFVVLAVVVIEVANMYNLSNCGNIMTNCPYISFFGGGFYLLLIGSGIGIISTYILRRN